MKPEYMEYYEDLSSGEVQDRAMRLFREMQKKYKNLDTEEIGEITFGIIALMNTSGYAMLNPKTWKFIEKEVTKGLDMEA